MKTKNIPLFLMLFLWCAVISAQQKDTHDQIKALKTAFITEKLAFNSTQAESFWPVYNLFDKRFHDLRAKRRKDIYHKIKNDWDKMTDAEAMKLLETYFTLEMEEIAIEKERIKALRSVISPKEIITLKIAEEDFKRELLKRYRAGKQD